MFLMIILFFNYLSKYVLVNVRTSLQISKFHTVYLINLYVSLDATREKNSLKYATISYNTLGRAWCVRVKDPCCESGWQKYLIRCYWILWEASKHIVIYGSQHANSQHTRSDPSFCVVDTKLLVLDKMLQFIIVPNEKRKYRDLNNAMAISWSILVVQKNFDILLNWNHVWNVLNNLCFYFSSSFYILSNIWQAIRVNSTILWSRIAIASPSSVVVVVVVVVVARVAWHRFWFWFWFARIAGFAGSHFARWASSARAFVVAPLSFVFLHSNVRILQRRAVNQTRKR